MRQVVVAQNVAEIEADALVIGLFAAEKVPAQGEGKKAAHKDEKNQKALSEQPVYTASALEVESATSGALSKIFQSGDFTGAVGDLTVLYAPEGIKARRVIVVGLGPVDAMTENVFIKAHEKAARATKAESFALTSEEWAPQGRDAAWCARTAVRTMLFAHYRIAGLKSKPEKNAPIESITWALNDEEAKDAVSAAIDQGRICAGAMIWAKEIADLPPNICDPSFMADAARSVAGFAMLHKAKDEAKDKHEDKHAEKHDEKHDDVRGTVTCSVMDVADLNEAGMGGILGVAQGSLREPRLIELAWHGADADEAPIVFVGKGVTFDAGGLNLKPGRSMPEMKYDMCGAAAALAVVKAASELKLKANIVAIAPCAENLPSGSALKPADIITMANGMSVEVLNADAEGRLLLADALVRAASYKPAVCFDLATLTGACIVALGTDVSGLFCSDDELTNEIAQAADSADDPVWPMPMGGRYREMLKSNCADIANVCLQPHAGACTAATFLKEFAPACPWAHLDIAGPANTSGANRESTSRPLPLIFEWLLAHVKAADAKKAEKAAKA